MTDSIAAALPRYLGVDAAGTYSSLSAKSIRRLLSAGKLHAYRPVRGRVLIDREELDAFILSSGAQKLRIGRGHRA
jgi:excisionase family DNA binding protein